MKNNFNIKTILESLKEDVENGKMSIREAAIELHKAGWTNFIDIDAANRLLKIQQSDLNQNRNGNKFNYKPQSKKYEKEHIFKK